MKTRVIVPMVALAAVAFFLGQGLAQDAEKDKGMGAPLPSAEHKKLLDSCGEWDVDCKMWMQPGAPPAAFKATAVRKAVLNGQFVTESFSCNVMGMKFEGFLLQGYDTIAKQYVNVWADNSSSVMSINRGTEKDGVITCWGTAPEAGQMKKTKSMLKQNDDGSFTMTEWDVLAEGQERQKMHFVYRRKKVDEPTK